MTGVVNIGERRLECIRFADEMVQLSEGEKEMDEIIQDPNEACKEYGM